MKSKNCKTNVKGIFCTVVQIGTPGTQFSDPRFSEILELMNKL